MSPARLIAHSEDRTEETAALELWEQLRTRVEKTVRESNVEAGEPLWTTAYRQGPTPMVVVRSTEWPANSVELIFDPARATVQCRFGPAIRRRDCEFDLQGMYDAALPECLLSVLDALILPDEN